MSRFSIPKKTRQVDSLLCRSFRRIFPPFTALEGADPAHLGTGAESCTSQ